MAVYNITTKFDEGELVYFIEKYPIKEPHPCPICGSTRKLQGRNLTEVQCPGCRGNKKIEEYSDSKWRLGQWELPSVIKLIRIEDPNSWDYKFSWYGSYGSSDERYISESDIFHTQAEALAECHKRNKE